MSSFTFHRSPERKDTLGEMRKEVLEKTDVLLSKDDPILKIIAHSLHMQERLELQQKRMIDDFKRDIKSQLIEILSLQDTHILKAANSLFYKIDAQVESSFKEPLARQQKLLDSTVEKVAEEIAVRSQNIRNDFSKELARLSTLVWIATGIALAAVVLNVVMLLRFF